MDKSNPQATLAAGESDMWWLRVKTDPAKCRIKDASKATTLEVAERESADACDAECRCGMAACSRH